MSLKERVKEGEEKEWTGKNERWNINDMLIMNERGKSRKLEMNKKEWRE